jgi:hypothetical protein
MGPLVTALEIRRSAQEQLQAWIPAYLAELERRYDIKKKLPAPKTWHRLPRFTRMSSEQSPAVLVTSPGLVEPPSRDGDGEFSAIWRLNVFVVVRGEDFQQTTDRVALYVAAVRLALMQQGIGLSSAHRPSWIGEGYDELEVDQARTIGAGVASFTVRIGQVLDDQAGPTNLPTAPEYVFPETIEADEVNISVDALED